MVELAPEIIALLCLAAVAAGFVDAIAGGGGLITVPALLAAGVPPVAAIATNKVQASFGTASATWSYWRAGRIDFGILKWPLAATLVGAGLGAFAVTVVDTRWLMVLLPVLLIAIALYFLFGPKASDEDAHARLTPLAYSAVAGGIGFYDGFFGPGTGSFFALSLVTLMGMGLTRATAHTKALNLMSNVISVVVLAAGGHVLWLLGGCMAVGQVIGGRLGAHSAMRFGPRLIRPLLVVISLGMVAKLLSDPANPLRIMVAGWFG
ncbi:TSUP family transporter [Brevundimonas nasdae]|uniref:Probable membrane transporter protein n=1 Tax=Brevundimonas nasdae TaxID=172043 RepID=A0ABX8TCJ5_9CAUL|nr:TSUP family transporter [Brevundimonas nasdae]QYC08903.1 TSUP family transporter [Brevundimonas nasdae]QYC14953.1 TSUP family transporter [Brevundimonas nasdae]